MRRGGEPIELTATEFRLLRYLMLNPRRVLTRAQLLDHVWDYDFGGDGARAGDLHQLPAQEARRARPVADPDGARRRLRRCGRRAS